MKSVRICVISGEKKHGIIYGQLSKEITRNFYRKIFKNAFFFLKEVCQSG